MIDRAADETPRVENLVGLRAAGADGGRRLLPFLSIFLGCVASPRARRSSSPRRRRSRAGQLRTGVDVASFGLLLTQPHHRRRCVPAVAGAGHAGGLRARHDAGPRRQRGLFGLFLAGLTLPVELIVIPLYFDLRGIGLTNSYCGRDPGRVGAVHAVRRVLDAHPLPEHPAGADRGGPDRRRRLVTVLRKVLLPLARPALSTSAVLVFMWSWNQFLLVLILLQDTTRHTAPAGLGFFVGQNTTDIPCPGAGTLIVMLPILVSPDLPAQLHRGLLQGAMKG